MLGVVLQHFSLHGAQASVVALDINLWLARHMESHLLLELLLRRHLHKLWTIAALADA